MRFQISRLAKKQKLGGKIIQTHLHHGMFIDPEPAKEAGLTLLRFLEHQRRP